MILLNFKKKKKLAYHREFLLSVGVGRGKACVRRAPLDPPMVLIGSGGEGSW